jgi:phosphoribosylcarboxyaminoimidazole (NCAIR) mutase
MTTDRAVSTTTPRFVDPAELKPGQLKADIERARSELAATLDAIEYKVNVPRKVKTAQRTLERKIQVVRRQNPSALIAGAVGAAAAVGLVAWGIAHQFIED